MKLARLGDVAPPRWGDAAVVGISLVALEVENATIGLHHVWVVVGALLAGAMTLAAIWRRHAPWGFVTAVLAMFVALVAVWSANSVEADATVTPLYVLILVPFLAARESSRRVAVAALAAVLICGLALDAWTGPTPASSYLSTAAATAAAWAAGRWLRARKLINDELALNMERVKAERERRIRLAVADERTRIARELHALIAGNVSAMVVQAEAAALLLERDAVAADRAMAAVEQTGRSALSGMRQVLGVLHADDSAPLAPQPGVGQLYALVEAERAAGRSIELSVEGEPGPLPASVDLGIYRVLADALGSGFSERLTVRLRFTEGSIELDVFASGAAALPPWPTLATTERATTCRGTVRGYTVPDGSRLSVSLPRHLEEVFA
jgi:signal transduction histidine kinase